MNLVVNAHLDSVSTEETIFLGTLCIVGLFMILDNTMKSKTIDTLSAVIVPKLRPHFFLHLYHSYIF